MIELDPRRLKEMSESVMAQGRLVIHRHLSELVKTKAKVRVYDPHREAPIEGRLIGFSIGSPFVLIVKKDSDGKRCFLNWARLTELEEL